MDSCIFCKIIRGEIPSRIAYEDEQILAFYDTTPQAKVHVLIIPKRHVPSAYALTDEHAALISHLFCRIPAIADGLGVAEDGFRIVTNCGQHGCQSVGHLHFHLLGGEQLSSQLC